MSKIVVFFKTEQSAERLFPKIDQFLKKAGEILRPFDQVSSYDWNSHRNRVTIIGGRFDAEVVLTAKGVIISANIPSIFVPFKQTIQKQISQAMEAIVGDQNEIN